MHLQKHSAPRIEFNKPQVVAAASDRKRLALLESLLIQEHWPTLNVDSASTSLAMFDV